MHRLKENGRSYSTRLRIEALESRRMLATLTVNTDSDVVDASGNPLINDGNLTLRDALAYVNGDAQPGPNEAVPGIIDGDLNDPTAVHTITFNEEVFGDGVNSLNQQLKNEIQLTEGELKITSSVIIDGAGATGQIGWRNLTILAASDSRIFDINLAGVPNQNVEIADLSLTGGSRVQSGGLGLAGGAIRAQLTSAGDNDQLTLERLRIHDNVAARSGGGVYVHLVDSNSVTVTDSIIERNTVLNTQSVSQGEGGGIAITNSSGTAVVERTIVRGNEIVWGGFGGRQPEPAAEFSDSLGILASE